MLRGEQGRPEGMRFLRLGDPGFGQVGVGPGYGSVTVEEGPVALFLLVGMGGEGWETNVPGGGAVVGFCYVVVAFTVTTHWAC